MKMSKYIFLVSLALAVGVSSSCSREEDEIFDKSAADRLTEAQENYYNILCSAPTAGRCFTSPAVRSRGIIS